MVYLIKVHVYNLFLILCILLGISYSLLLSLFFHLYYCCWSLFAVCVCILIEGWNMILWRFLKILWFLLIRVNIKYNMRILWLSDRSIYVFLYYLYIIFIINIEDILNRLGFENYVLEQDHQSYKFKFFLDIQ